MEQLVLEADATLLAFMHLSLYFAVCFQVVNKLVVLPCGADTTLRHCLHIVCCWLISLALNPKYFEITDDDPRRETNSLISAASDI